MDKVKIALAVIKKQHCWILCGLAVIVAFVSWALASSDLADLTTKRKGAIKTATDTASGIARDTKHPNDVVIQRVKVRNGVEGTNPKSLTLDVFKAWTKLYNDQKAKNHLPQIYGADGAQFQRQFEEDFNRLWGPLEKVPDMPEMLEPFREKYANHIITIILPRLSDLIDRRRMPDMTAAVTQDRASFNTLIGTVDWDDYDRVVQRFNISTGAPNTLQVMVAQEDLWVLEALLRVVRTTNDASTDGGKTYVLPASHKMANVKRILAVQSGVEAVDTWTKSAGAVIKLASDAGAADPSAGAAGAGRGPVTTGVVGENKLAILAGRYVDEQGKALMDPAQPQPYAEFRMMPIVLKVSIEQLAIPRFLTACVNSSMPIDVRAVRLLESNPPPFVAADDSRAGMPGLAPGPVMGPMPLSRPGMFPGEGGRDLSAPMRRGPQMLPPGGIGAPTAPVDMYEEARDPSVPPVTIEIQGTIYIYNPPDLSKLGTGTAKVTAAGAAPAAGSGVVPAAAPAAAPAAPAIPDSSAPPR